MGCEKREIVFRSPDFLCRLLFIPKKEHKAPSPVKLAFSIKHCAAYEHPLQSSHL